MTIAMLDPAKFVVLVTGATSGMGEAIARRFVEAGARVVATGRRADRLARLAEELGERLHAAELDVRDYAATEALVAGLPEPFRALNVVVANAGLALGLKPAQEADMEDWRRMIDTNVTGLVNTVRASLPGMVERGRGHVVAIGSIAGDYPYAGGNVYGGTKAFVKQFCLALRSDLVGTNVRVTNIEPGMTETEFSLVRFKGDEARAASVYDGAEVMSGADVAEMVFWCASLPEHVSVARLQATPTDQAFARPEMRRKAGG